MDRKKLSLIILAVICAFVIRFWKLETLPFPPDGDEVAFGYYGWSLLHFGTDEFGNQFPSSFLSIGDFKYPGLAYLNMIPAAFFGLQDITTRFWSALSGVMLVPPIYLLALIIFENQFTAIASSWLAVFSPWSIIESRLGYENHLSMMITTLAFVLLMISLGDKTYKIGKIKIGLQKHKKKLAIASFSLLVLSVFIYAAQRVFIPLMLFAMLVMSLGGKSRIKDARKRLLVMLIALVSIIVLSLVPETNRGRAVEESWKGITYEQRDRQARLHVQAGISPVKVPVLFTRVMHNKYRIAMFDMASRYLDHFSPSFLFFKGEASDENIPDMGVLLLVEILLLPVGLITLLSNAKKERVLIILAWLIIAPLASSLTTGGAHINRASNMIPVIALISGNGLSSLIAFFKRKGNGLVRLATGYFVSILLFLVIAYSAAFALNQIFVQKPVDRPWVKQQVNARMAKSVLSLKDSYKAVVLPDDDYIFFLFYGGIDPKHFIEKSEIQPFSIENRWERVERFENIYFKMPFNCPKGGKLDVLYVCAGEEIPQNSRLIKTIYYLDGVAAYNFVEFYPLSKMPSELPALPKSVHYMVDVEKKLEFPDGIIPVENNQMW